MGDPRASARMRHRMARRNHQGWSSPDLAAERLEWRCLLSVAARAPTPQIRAWAATSDSDTHEVVSTTEPAIHPVNVGSTTIDTDEARNHVAPVDIDDAQEVGADEASDSDLEKTPDLALVGDSPTEMIPALGSAPESVRHEQPATVASVAIQPLIAPVSQPAAARVDDTEDPVDPPVSHPKTDGKLRAARCPAKEDAAETERDVSPADLLARVQPIGSPFVAALFDRALRSFEEHAPDGLGDSWTEAYRLSLISAGAIVVGSLATYRRLHTVRDDRSITRAAVARSLVPGLWPLRSP